MVEILDRFRPLGAKLVGDVIDYQEEYRLCHIRGPDELLIRFAEELG